MDANGSLQWLKRSAPKFAHKVHPLYIQLDWHWHEDEVLPTEADVCAALFSLIESVEDQIRNEPGCLRYAVSSGGLMVSVQIETDPPDMNDYIPALEFGYSEEGYEVGHAD